MLVEGPHFFGEAHPQTNKSMKAFKNCGPRDISAGRSATYNVIIVTLG